MKYNIELYIMRRRIEQVGEYQAFEWASFEAWYKALQATKPRHSMQLDRTEIDEYEIGGPHAFKVRFYFIIDALKSQDKAHDPADKKSADPV